MESKTNASNVSQTYLFSMSAILRRSRNRQLPVRSRSSVGKCPPCEDNFAVGKANQFVITVRASFVVILTQLVKKFHASIRDLYSLRLL